MRNLYLYAIVVFACIQITPVSAVPFEGQYDMRMTGDGESVDVSFWVKDGHVKIKVAGKGAQMGEMIMRDGMKSMIMVMPQQRMYMEMDIPLEDIIEPAPEAGSDEFPFRKTGNKRDILGMQAEEFVLEKDNEKMTIWATDELGSMPFANNPFLQGWSQAMRRMTGLDDFFPLETTGTENGKEAYKMTVTKVEKKSLPESMFQPPEGFMKMTLPAGMGGMMFPGGR